MMATGGGSYTPKHDPCMDIMLEITNKKTIVGLENFDGDSIPVLLQKGVPREGVSTDEVPIDLEIEVTLAIFLPRLKIFM